MTGEVQNMGDSVDQAIDWHLRLATATREEWIAFTDWLEASPKHAEAYDRLVLNDALLSPVLEETPSRVLPAAANDHDVRARGTWRFVAAGSAIAAAMTLAVVTSLGGGGDADARYAVETKAGERKQVAFADGTRILVNSGSRITLDRANPRFAALDAGEATFLIRHDLARPFTLRSGTLTLQDLGTVFNVARDGKRLGVQVSEGAVMFEPAREGLTLRPGVSLSVDETSRRIELSRVAVEDVGGWRAGRLSFGAAPLASVAASLGRATGAAITVSPELSATSFTGTITVSGDAAVMVPRLARLTGVTWRRNGSGWILAARDDEAR